MFGVQNDDSSIEKRQQPDDKNRKTRGAAADVVHQQPEILPTSAQDHGYPVSGHAEKIIASEATIVFHVTDYRFDRRPAFSKALETTRKIFAFVAVANVDGRLSLIAMAAIAAIHKRVLDPMAAAQTRRLFKTGCQRMPIVRIAVKTKRS